MRAAHRVTSSAPTLTGATKGRQRAEGLEASERGSIAEDLQKQLLHHACSNRPSTVRRGHADNLQCQRPRNPIYPCNSHPTWLARTVGVMASGGSGSETSTLLAEKRSLNWLRALTRYSVSNHQMFQFTPQPPRAPHLACAHGGRDGVGRQWEGDLDVAGGGALLELAARLDQVLGPAAAVALHRALHPDQRPHVLAQPVRPVFHSAGGVFKRSATHCCGPPPRTPPRPAAARSGPAGTSWCTRARGFI